MLFSILLENEMSVQEIVLALVMTAVVFLISLTVHEFAHGITAYKFGDDTPKVAGRLTLNPLKHLDLTGAISFLILGIGWAKPMPVNPIKFKKYKTGMRIVSIAGIVTNFLLGLVSAILYAVLMATVGVPTEFMVYVYLLLQYFMVVNSFLALFNLIPIFPFDGFNFVSTFCKTENKYIRFNLKNGSRLLIWIIVGSMAISLFTGFDILDWYLSILYNFVYAPIALLGV